MTKLNSKSRDKFLDELRRSGSITQAAKRAAIGRRTAYIWRDDDPDFAEAWEDAKQEYCDDLEAEADRRAREGVPSHLYFDKDGNIVGEVRRYSDTLLIFRLKALRPEKYRDPPQGIDPRVIQVFLQQVLLHVDEAAKQNLLSWVEGHLGIHPHVNNTSPTPNPRAVKSVT